MTFAMTVHERESFLEAVRIGVLSITEPDRGPLSAPVWYGYEAGGELWFVTGRESRKGKLLEVGIRISLCVQTEDPPYQIRVGRGAADPRRYRRRRRAHSPPGSPISRHRGRRPVCGRHQERQPRGLQHRRENAPRALVDRRLRQAIDHRSAVANETLRGT